MKRSLFISLVMLGVSAPLIATSCSVNRRTEDFTCATDGDCGAGRRCDPNVGYCVVGGAIPDARTDASGCPAACNGGCDLTAKTCTIACTGSNCTDVVCPGGYDCTINCGSNGCDSVTCNGESECTINCIGGNACGNVDCGAGDCNVVCSGANACNNVDCNDARCDVTCTGANACNDVDCDSGCRCDVKCTIGNSCDALTCSGPACQSATGCTSTQNNCPSTCP